jgi:hypothetical protein
VAGSKAQAIIAQSAARQQSEASSHDQYISGLVSNYEAKLSASKIPDAAVYKGRLERYAQEIHPEIRRAILEHPEPDVVTAAITSSKKTLDWYIEQSKRNAGRIPVAAIAKLGEDVAMFRQRGTPEAKKAEVAKKVATLPPTPSGRSASSTPRNIVTGTAAPTACRAPARSGRPAAPAPGARFPLNDAGGCGKYHKEFVFAGCGGPYMLLDQVTLG